MHNGRSGHAIRCIHIKKELQITLPRVPNGLPLSRRERSVLLSKNQRSCARSGRLQRRVRRPDFGRSHAPRMCRPHRHRTTPSTTGVRSESRSPGITRGTTGVHLNHTHLESRCPQRAFSTTGVRTTPGTTSLQHNGRSYHTGITDAGTTERAQRALGKHDSLDPYRKGNDDHAATGAERVAVQRCAFEIGMTASTISLFKIAPISGRVARPLQRLVRRHLCLRFLYKLQDT